ncbi:hypothetical protein F5Y15DRAFT_412381 [Xylariaceae sp. FL0016]|nr:hypothetical protein F5Y15DRAFT_412381 [Xylariaceae sp. FL0016]
MSKYIQEAKDCFSQHVRFEFEKIAGQGGNGFALLYKDKQAPPGGWERFIVKGAKGAAGRAELRREAGIMSMLRLAEHIVARISLDGGPQQPGVVDGSTTGLNIDNCILLEYISHGTLSLFLQSVRNAGEPHLPNRMLWYIFLCLLRACAGMAFPRDPFSHTGIRNLGAKRTEVIPKTIAELDLEAFDIVHRDMHLDNFMFGDLQNGSREHYLVPILKMIDFGEANGTPNPSGPRSEEWMNNYDRPLSLQDKSGQYVTDLQSALAEQAANPPAANIPQGGPIPTSQYRWDFSNTGTLENIIDIGVVMGILMTSDFSVFASRFEMRRLMVRMPTTAATDWPGMDQRLWKMVSGCLAEDESSRPTLAVLLDTASVMVDYYAVPANQSPTDTDEYISNLVQKYIFDADVGVDTSTAIVLS